MKSDTDAWKRCPECLEPVGFRVKICPNCKSFQDWRRYVAIGQTNVALAVAIISVSTTALNILIPALQERGESISALFIDAKDDKAYFLAHNAGRAGGVLSIGNLSIKTEFHQPGLKFEIPFDAGNSYVEGSKDLKLDVSLRDGTTKLVCDRLKEAGLDIGMFGKAVEPDQERYVSYNQDVIKKVYDRLKCSFSYNTKDYNSVRSVDDVKTSCKGYPWIEDCILSTLR